MGLTEASGRAVADPRATVLGQPVRGTLAGRIALVTTAVAVMTALIVMAVSVPQIRSRAIGEAQLSLSRAADSAMDQLSRGVPLEQLGPNNVIRVRGSEIDIYAFNLSEPPPFVPLDVVGALASGRDYSNLVSMHGARYLAEGRSDPEGRALVAVEPESVAVLSATRSLAQLGAALLMGAGIAALAGLALARWLARPLKEAAAAADEMANGQRDISIDPEGPVEVYEVANSLNELNAALSASETRQREFLLSVSHELRTPLTSVQGYSEALADGVVPSDDVADTAAVLNSEARRLDRLVSDLLDLARMGAREVQIDMIETEVTPLLAETARVWRDRCAGEGVPFDSHISTSGLTLLTDPVRLRQILDNLLGNALRITPPGKPIVLDADVQNKGTPTEALRLQVRDGGPGLSEDDMAVAFEPAELYSRYQGVRKVGSGVGLALVGRLAQRLGGQAVAGSAPEGGAMFTITLPVGGTVGHQSLGPAGVLSADTSRPALESSASAD